MHAGLEKSPAPREVLESISRIIAALGIPAVLGVGGWIIQGTVSQQTVSKDYVLLATDILKTKREAGEDGALRKWAVDLLNRTKLAYAVVAEPALIATATISNALHIDCAHPRP
jgi:hypothetical protein